METVAFLIKLMTYIFLENSSYALDFIDCRSIVLLNELIPHIFVHLMGLEPIVFSVKGKRPKPFRRQVHNFIFGTPWWS